MELNSFLTFLCVLFAWEGDSDCGAGGSTGHKAGTSSQQVPQATDGTNPSYNKNRNLGGSLPYRWCFATNM